MRIMNALQAIQLRRDWMFLNHLCSGGTTESLPGEYLCVCKIVLDEIAIQRVLKRGNDLSVSIGDCGDEYP